MNAKNYTQKSNDTNIEFEVRTFKFEGKSSIPTNDLIDILKNINDIYKVPQRDLQIDVKTIEEGSMIINIIVEVVPDIFGDNNVIKVDELFKAFEFLGKELLCNAIGLTVGMLASKIKSKKSLSRDEVYALLDYMQTNPDFAFIANQKSFQDIKKIANKVVKRDCDLTLIDADGEEITKLTTDTAFLTSEIATKDLERDNINELMTSVMELKIKSPDYIGNADWSFYNVSDGFIDKKVIKMSIHDEDFLATVRNRGIGFKSGDRIIAEVDTVPVGNKTKYNLIRYIEKIEG